MEVDFCRVQKYRIFIIKSFKHMEFQLENCDQMILQTLHCIKMTNSNIFPLIFHNHAKNSIHCEGVITYSTFYFVGDFTLLLPQCTFMT